LPWSQVIDSQLEEGAAVPLLPTPPLFLLQAPSIAATAMSASVFQIADLIGFSLQFV
jgi:hypothetical protein